MRYAHALRALPLALLLGAAPSGAQTITEKNLRFVEYPDFPTPFDLGSIGYSTVHKKVFIGVTNHGNREGIYEYDVRSGQMSLRGFIDLLVNLRDFQWQGKVHTKIVEGPDGAMYFATDAERAAKST